MSPGEMLFRTANFFQKTIEKARDVGKLVKPVLVTPPGKILQGIKNNILYSHHIKIFDKSLDYSGDIDWHLDLSTSIRSPQVFSKNINILSEKTGCAKYIWEVNRLLFLPQLCLNYIKTKDNKYLKEFIRINDSWIENNPYLLGINWYSNIEVNIRLINWFLCWEILNINELVNISNGLNDFVQNRWLPVIYLHCLYSYKNPSGFSSANNHLISEYAGLFIASSLWKFKESEKWNIYAKKGLETEIQKQHSENGINKEEAAEYIQFVTDFLLMAYITGEQTNNKFSPEFRQMLGKIFYYIYRFTDIKCNIPRYGDDDDGRVFILNPGPDDNNYKSLLTSGTIIFRDPELKAKSNGFDIKNQILFGNEGEETYKSIKTKYPDLKSYMYREEGHFILRRQNGDKEIYIHFDAAPLGYLSIAAHGHADALSFVLHINGREVLADPGTFSYHTHNVWRQYFIGTLAHNTIRINNRNQALNAGPTLWLKHYKTTIKESESNEKYDKVTASHDGYKKSGISHTRKIIFEKANNSILLTDYIEYREGKDISVEFPLHLHPEMFPEIKEDYISVSDPGKISQVKIFHDPKFNIKIVKGVEQPLMGWYSGSFYKKEPAYMIYQNMNINSSVAVETRITVR